MSDVKDNKDYINKGSSRLVEQKPLKQKKQTCTIGKTEIRRKADKLKMVGLAVVCGIISILAAVAFGGPAAALISKENQNQNQKKETPILRINNGSIKGLYLDSFQQDAYLGIPYAEPPLESRRFVNPQSYNHSWGDNVKEFTSYGDACIATGGTDSTNLKQSEDCLTLNIVKPHGYEDHNLPVAIWIHGGSYYDGSGARPAYNLSFIVQNGASIGKPFIGISINYRLSGFGWLSSQQVAGKGWTNVGLRDQLKAVEWVHENIQAFGGNPEHLVLWGESAGGQSVGHLLTSGKLGDYVKGAIMESGTAPSRNKFVAGYAQNQKEYEMVVDYFNCTEEIDSLACLQKVDAWELANILNTTNGYLLNAFHLPYIDGDLVPKYPSIILEEGNFAKVPILLGTMTDEGGTFTDTSINSTQEFKAFVNLKFPYVTSSAFDKINELYSFSDPKVQLPLDPTYNTTEIQYPENFGAHWPRAATFYGDAAYIGHTRIATKKFSKFNLPVYKYRFNIPDSNFANKPYFGAPHFHEVVYVFDSSSAPMNDNDGYKLNSNPKSSQIAKTTSKMWASFISDLDPNFEDVQHSADNEPYPKWLSYSEGAKNLVFDLNGIYLEEDNFRKEQLDFLESILPQLQA